MESGIFRAGYLNDLSLLTRGQMAECAVGPGSARFFATLNGTDFGSVHTPAGSLKVLDDYTAIASNPDRRVRREGYEPNQKGLAKNRDVYADILVSTATALNKAARLRGYPDYPASKVYRSSWRRALPT